MTAGQDTEGGAGIADISQTEQVIDDGDRMVEGHRPIDNEFSDLVGDNDEAEPGANDLGFCVQAETPDLRT